MRQVRATHPAVYAIDSLLQSGLETIQVIKASGPSMWDKQATRVSRLIANVEDGWVEAAAYFASWKTQTTFTIDDLKKILDAVNGAADDMNRVHSLLHEVETSVAMEHDRVTMAVESMVSLYHTAHHLFKHVQEVMIVETGLTAEEKDKHLNRPAHPQGPMFFSGTMEDFLRHLRGEDVD